MCECLMRWLRKTGHKKIVPSLNDYRGFPLDPLVCLLPIFLFFLCHLCFLLVLYGGGVRGLYHLLKTLQSPHFDLPYHCEITIIPLKPIIPLKYHAELADESPRKGSKLPKNNWRHHNGVKIAKFIMHLF